MRRREFLNLTTGLAGATALGRLGTAWGAERRSMRDIIVLLPGVTGSVLQKDGRDVWALSGEGVFGAIRSLGRNLDAIRMSGESPEKDDLGDGITAPRLFEDVHLIPGLWKIDGYTRTKRSILENFQVEAGRNFFEFPYDWRRDNRIAARKLAQQSHAWLKAWRESSGSRDAKLILVAHSMGGLVSRYFIECMEGWRDTKRLITFGTPFRGSVNALNFLCNGYSKNMGPFTVVDLSPLLRSFPSIYQLLPTYPCYDSGGGKPVRVGEAQGIPNVSAEWAASALRFHREMDEAVTSNRGLDAYRASGYRGVNPVVGVFQETLQWAKLVGDKVECSTVYPGQPLDGDGTVPRPSATPLEMTGEQREVFAAEVHGSLQNAGALLKHLSGVLADASLDWMAFRSAASVRLSLRVDDVYAHDEPIRFEARYSPSDAPLRRNTVVVNASTRKAVTAQPRLTPAKDGKFTISYPPLPPGTYRVTLNAVDQNSKAGSQASVTDVFVVAGRANA